MYILSIETSCDETSAAVLCDNKVISNIVSSQYFHSEFGGVVPEIASREHLRGINEITGNALKEAGISLKQINLVTATNEPGLLGAILIGLNYAKSLAFTLNVPFIPVNHIQAHIYSPFINSEPEFPYISMIISGGHTILLIVKDYFSHNVLGTTLDDAVGESFDKVAKMLGLGYPGGPQIDKLSKKGDKNFHKFPKVKLKGDKYNFSFSGLKTSMLYLLKKIRFEENRNEKLISDLCASYQNCIINILLEKLLKASDEFGIKKISVSGGVSANSELKISLDNLKKYGYKISIPEKQYSTDNAAMVGYLGYLKYIRKSDNNCFRQKSFSIEANPRIRLNLL
jgi:N6-L-threonylcarbamoyladenine synthase